jgi:hypothetical protein
MNTTQVLDRPARVCKKRFKWLFNWLITLGGIRACSPTTTREAAQVVGSLVADICEPLLSETSNIQKRTPKFKLS